MTKQEKYIDVRMTQLAEERDKAHDEHDRMWFNRCIQELDWVKQMQSKPTHNCYMQTVTFTSPEEQRIYDLKSKSSKDDDYEYEGAW